MIDGGIATGTVIAGGGGGGLSAILSGAGKALLGGVLGGIFGGKKKRQKSYSEQVYEAALREAVADANALEYRDRAIVDQTRRKSMEDAERAIASYSARTAAAGSGEGQYDSRKEVAKSNIAYQSTRRASDLEAELASSLPYRKRDLVLGGGYGKDLYNMQTDSQDRNDAAHGMNMEAIMAMAKELLKGKKGTPQYT